MPADPDFDLTAAHHYFSAACFNQAWDLMDMPSRTAEQDEHMVRLTLASAYHWSQRQDVTATNYSVAYWQTSRVYALVGQAENALRYGGLCLQASQQAGVLPFYVGYAYEALARAAALAGDAPLKVTYLEKAYQVAGRVEDEGERNALISDLKTI
jgi:hypothetical protein